MTNVPVFKPLIGPDEIGAAVSSLEMGWLGMGSYVDQLERALSSDQFNQFSHRVDIRQLQVSLKKKTQAVCSRIRQKRWARSIGLLI